MTVKSTKVRGNKHAFIITYMHVTYYVSQKQGACRYTDVENHSYNPLFSEPDRPYISS